MGLSNLLREQTPRTIGGHQHKGVVVDTNDPLKLSRVKIRSHTLHRGVPDADLPWITPATQHSSNSSGNNQGKHGPIPPKGTEIYFRFRDDSQYFGEYYGAPIHKKTQVSEFGKAPKEAANSNSGSSGTTSGSSAGATSAGEGSNAGGESSGSEYEADYPHVEGNVNPSGSLAATNHKRDTEEERHITGTGRSTDGKGNVEEIVNGGYKNPNKDAKEKHPEGKSVHVHGDCVLYVSGNVKIHGGKDVEVVGGQNVRVHAAQTVFVSAGQKIALSAPSITTSVEIVLAAGESPKKPTAPKKAEPRKRPELKAPENDENY